MYGFHTEGFLFFMLIELVHEVILRLRHEFDVKPWLEQTQLKVTVEKAAPSYAALMSLVPPHWQGHLRIDIEVDANGAARSILRGNTWSLRDKMDMMGYYENKQGEQLPGKEPGSSLYVLRSGWSLLHCWLSWSLCAKCWLRR